MKIARRLAILAVLVLCGIAPDCHRDNSFPRRLVCCGTPAATVAFTQQLATNAGEVPVEIHGCGPNGDEITAIGISGRLVGCVGSDSDVTFPDLTVQFTMRRCDGNPNTRPPPEVTFTNVHYTSHIPSGTPACVSTSQVNAPGVGGPGYDFHTDDPGFAALFARSGPQTLLPILDRYVLGWAESIPARSTAPAVCPPRPRLGGTTSRCPS